MRSRGAQLEIVSDGLGFYVSSNLAAIGLHDIPVATNENRVGAGRDGMSFPYGHPACFVCGTCKRERVRLHQASGRIVVFIGDGTSDRYAAAHADLVFAKGSLARFCADEGWPFVDWSSFADVTDAVNRAFEDGRLPADPTACLPGVQSTAANRSGSSAVPRCGVRAEPRPYRPPPPSSPPTEGPHRRIEGRSSSRAMIGSMKFSFLVSVLLAFSLAATVLATALLVGLFPTGGGTSVATPGPQGSFVASTSAPATPATTAEPTAGPTPTPAATIDPAQGGTYTVKPGESLSLIGEKVGVPWQLIAEANGITPPDYVITPGQVLIIPPIPVPTGGADFHVVQSGDTITAIAEAAGVSPTDLADFNNIADWNSIRVGDILYIPGPGWTPLPEPSF